MQQQSTTATDFFSEIAVAFDGQYRHRAEFADRMLLWSAVIDKYASGHKRVIDVGCGSGVLSFYAAKHGANVVGIDGAEGMVGVCNKYRLDHGIESSRFVLGRLPDRSLVQYGPADVVICSSVLEYVPEFDNALLLLRDLLVPGGVLLVSMPNRQSWYRKLLRIVSTVTGKPKYYRYVKNVYSIEKLKAKAATIGLEYVEHTFFNYRIPLSKVLTKIFPKSVTANLFLAVFRKSADKGSA